MGLVDDTIDAARGAIRRREIGHRVAALAVAALALVVLAGAPARRRRRR